MKWVVLALLAVVSFLAVRRKFRKWKNNPLRIKKKVWYSGGLKMSVNIRNVRKNMIVDISAPIIEFRKPRMKKRKYKIVNPGDESLFPLGLSPLTSYNFVVEFTKLYEREPILRKYKHVVIHVNDDRGKNIMKKRVNVLLSKYSF